jgi:DNA-binding XRE family transcriptional regulator
MSSNEATTTTTTTRAETREERAERRRRMRNNVRKLREDRLLSKAELARRAGVSPLTIDRIESGKPCRMDTKRKIILALGMTIEDKDQVFLKEEEGTDLDTREG